MNSEATAKMLRYRWLIFSVLALAYFFVYFHRLSLSVVADDLVRDFNTTAGVMGLLASIYFYCYAGMQFPAGLLSDSIGPRKTVAVFLLLASAGSIIFGLSSGFTMAFAGRILVGFGVSMVFIPTMKILAQWFRPGEFAFMAGILNAVGGIGVIGATWALAEMAGQVGWRLSFQLIGLCTLVIAGLSWLIVRDRPQDKGWVSASSIDTGSSNPATAIRRIPLWEGARQVVSNKYFWPVAIWFFFDCGIFFGFGGLWAGPYLMHVYGMSKTQAGMVLSMIAWGMIIGSPLLGFLSDKVFKSRKKMFMFCTTTLVIVLTFLNLYPSSLPRMALFLVFFIFSVCASAIVVIGFTTTKELFPVEIAGTSVGTVNLFPFLGGAVFMPLLGRVLDAYPKAEDGQYSMAAYSTLLLILLGAAVVSLACTFFMKETFEK